MTPLVPKGRGGWTADPGHIADAPEPPPMPDEQGELGPGEAVPAEPAPGGAPSALSPGEPAGGEDGGTAYDAREGTRDAAPLQELSEVDVPRALAQEIRRAMKRYPQTRSASIPALWAVQRR